MSFDDLVDNNSEAEEDKISAGLVSHPKRGQLKSGLKKTVYKSTILGQAIGKLLEKKKFVPQWVYNLSHFLVAEVTNINMLVAAVTNTDIPISWYDITFNSRIAWILNAANVFYYLNIKSISVSCYITLA